MKLHKILKIPCPKCLEWMTVAVEAKATTLKFSPYEIVKMSYPDVTKCCRTNLIHSDALLHESATVALAEALDEDAESDGNFQPPNQETPS